jgi:hypothetical protein
VNVAIGLLIYGGGVRGWAARPGWSRSSGAGFGRRIVDLQLDLRLTLIFTTRSKQAGQ